MPSKHIPQLGRDRFYFLTLTVRHWYYIFDRCQRWNILTDSLNHCIKNKNVKVWAYVFMLNHIHLIINAPDVIGFLRDFKRHTTRELKKNMQTNEPLVAQLFFDKDKNFSVWKKTNMPIMLETEKVFHQKWRYIENNPVKKEYVTSSDHWLHSSAHPQCPVKVLRNI